jgi:hypothetical protein
MLRPKPVSTNANGYAPNVRSSLKNTSSRRRGTAYFSEYMVAIFTGCAAASITRAGR